MKNGQKYTGQPYLSLEQKLKQQIEGLSRADKIRLQKAYTKLSRLIKEHLKNESLTPQLPVRYQQRQLRPFLN
jgi:hypothetical protein